MKAIVLQSDMELGLKIVARTVIRRGKAFLPTTTFVNISISGDRLMLATSNLAQFTQVTLSCKPDAEEGSIAVPFVTLSDLISLLPEGALEIYIEEREAPEENESDDNEQGQSDLVATPGNVLVVQATKNKTRIKGFDSEEHFYQALSLTDRSLDDNIPWVEIAAQKLQDICSSTVIATIEEEARPVLHAVKLEADGKEISATAADGFRLAICESDYTDSGAIDQLLVPASAVKSLLFLLKDVDAETVWFKATTDMVAFKTENVLLMTYRSGGIFPDISRMTEDLRDFNCLVNRDSLIRALRLLNATGKSSGHVIRFATSGNQVDISTNSADIGDQKITIDLDSTEGPATTNITFNGKFMLETLGVMGTAQVKISYHSKDLKPMMIEPVGGSVEMQHLIMPIIMREANAV